MPETHRAFAELVAVHELSPTVRSLTLEVRSEPFEWSAGQYVELLVPSDGGVARQPFSIASAPDAQAPGRFELAVSEKEQSPVTTTVRSLELGARVELLGPNGKLSRRGLEEAPTLLVGTGSGLAPLRAIIQDELRSGEGPQLALLFGCRSEEDLLWAPELRRFASEHPRFRYEPTLSQPSRDWTGRSGYVQEHVGEVLRSFPDAAVLLCGKGRMVEAVQRELRRLGHPDDRVVTERQG